MKARKLLSATLAATFITAIPFPAQAAMYCNTVCVEDGGGAPIYGNPLSALQPVEPEPEVVTVYTSEQSYMTSQWKEALGRLLYCEAGSTSWDCQVWTCSAILNLLDYFGEDLYTAMHNPCRYDVQDRIDSVTPTQTQYDVIEYVLGGGRVAGVAAFRTGHYHDFGTPMCEIDGVYFSEM